MAISECLQSFLPRVLPPAQVAQDVVADLDGLHLTLVAPFAVSLEKTK